MAHYEEKPGFRNITEVRNFLYGTNNRKHSKVYLRIKEQDGHYYLTIWTDNNFTADEVTGGEAFLKEINGFKERYQLKMNKVEKNEFLMETVQDITTIAVDIVSKATEDEGYDSRDLFSECRRWAEEFEKIWDSYVKAGEEDDHDYMLEVEEFAERKAKKYLGIR